MNLYKLHADAKNVLDNYDRMNDLLRNSTKTVFNDGDTEYLNVFGDLHRDDGPAWITAGGVEYWYKFGKKHRDDGPAVVYANGDTEYWYEGQYYKNMQIMQTQNELI